MGDRRKQRRYERTTENPLAGKSDHTLPTPTTDANTMVNREAIQEIVLAFQDPKVGCVAGEKRIAVQTKDGAAAGGEGIYWKYESTLKALDARLYSAVGAAGELFAVRRELFEAMEPDTLLDDFILSLIAPMLTPSKAVRQICAKKKSGKCASLREDCSPSGDFVRC